MSNCYPKPKAAQVPVPRPRTKWIGRTVTSVWVSISVSDGNVKWRQSSWRKNLGDSVLNSLHSNDRMQRSSLAIPMSNRKSRSSVYIGNINVFQMNTTFQRHLPHTVSATRSNQYNYDCNGSSLYNSTSGQTISNFWKNFDRHNTTVSQLLPGDDLAVANTGYYSTLHTILRNFFWLSLREFLMMSIPLLNWSMCQAFCAVHDGMPAFVLQWDSGQVRYTWSLSYLMIWSPKFHWSGT